MRFSPRDHRSTTSACLLAALILGSMACSSMSGMEPLEVTLSNIQFGEVTVFETSLTARLRLTNPNPEPFAIDGASFKLYLNDKKVGTGTTAEAFTIERLDSTVVDVQFHLNNAAAILRMTDLFARKDQIQEVSYGIRGSLFTQGTFGTAKIKVDRTGTIDWSRIEGGGKLPEHDSIKPLNPEQ